MIIGIGVDIIEIERIKQVVDKTNGFLKRVFTSDEVKYFEQRKNNPEVIAGNFAAKEAVVKAMGTGINGFEWTDVEILRDSLGKPYVLLYNEASKILANNCVIHVSISHCKEYAVANSVIESWDGIETFENVDIALKEQE